MHGAADPIHSTKNMCPPADAKVNVCETDVWSAPASNSEDDGSSTCDVDVSQSYLEEIEGVLNWEHNAMQGPRKRAVLTDDQAAEIFNLRVPFTDATNASPDRVFTSRSMVVSRIYGVSPKAVRDIWNKRTWRHATRAFWTEADELQHAKNLKAGTDGAAQRIAAKKLPSLRSVGRPRGSKDSKPRRPRRARGMGAGAMEDELSSAPVGNDDTDIADAGAGADASAGADRTPDAREPRADVTPEPALAYGVDELEPAAPHAEEEEVCDEEDLSSEYQDDDDSEESVLYRCFPFFLHFPLVAEHDPIYSV